MPRPIGRPLADKPKYCLDKPSQRAFVTLAKKRIYLGRHGTRESRDEYDRLIGEWIAKGRPRTFVDDVSEGPTVTHIILAFWTAHQTHYAPYSHDNPPPAGKRPHDELGHFFDALKVLRRMYGPTPAQDFCPL